MTAHHSIPRESRWWAIWAVIAAFGTYFCMYGFRRPFTVATYADHNVLGLSFKSLAVIAQVCGYTLSKFIGIKFVSELPSGRRAAGILGLIAFAELSLLLFALIPFPYNALALFLNGIPLGMVFGFVIGYLEGRRMTEALSAGLCTSFILADGFTKSVGSYLLVKARVSDEWMPFTAGLTFLPPLVIFVWMLTKIPPPTAEDLQERSERQPVNMHQRRDFFRRYAGGLIPLIVVYFLITIIRGLRADFQPEIWRGLGQETKPAIFTQTEIWVALGALIANACSIWLRDNRRAFLASLGVSLVGLFLVALALLLESAGTVNGFTFMVITGLGLYLPYVAFHTTIFERLIAVTRDRANMGYLIYLADAIGYLGYVAVMLARELGLFGIGSGAGARDMLTFFTASCWGTVFLSAIMLAICWICFARRRNESPNLANSD